ncbi:MAG: hypothetical protein QF685_04765 [Verrucomicrobiota bacterium]|jgi:hypothetical protein|nr:hypothetical protein [Verrucomicrobiota bacterium]
MKSTGKVRVALIGFGQQKTVSEDQIIRALGLLPDAHLADLLCVKYDPYRDIRFSGWYDPGQKGITIFRFMDEWDFYQLLYHEIAHHVFDNVLSINERYTWVNEISRSEGYVSSYALKNTQEDFAESYSLYVFGPALLLGFREKFRFMKQVVFSGYAPNSFVLSLPFSNPKTHWNV